MRKLYVFGDSFATPYVCVDPKESFWGLSAKELKVDEIYSYAWSGNGLENIIHTILNEPIDFNDSNSYYIIGIPPLLRHSIYYDNKIKGIPSSSAINDRNLYKFSKDFEKVNPIDALSLTGVGNWEFEKTFRNDREYVSYFHAEWRDILSLEKIYLLDSFLKNKNAKFMIVNLTVDIHYQDQWPAGKEIMKKINELNTCFMFADSYHDLNTRDGIKPADYERYGWMGHHGPEGNLNWYNKHIKKNMINLGWV